jgi:hypothetical protein
LPKISTILLPFILLSFVETSVAQHALSADKIGKLLPSKIKGYYPHGEGKNSLITLGKIRYSLAERGFRSRTKTIKFLLFDYVEAPIMYNQAIKKWRDMKTINSDSIVYQPIARDSSAWESWSRSSQSAQIVIGINNRFFLNISSEKISLDELRVLVNVLPFDKFPR